MTTSVTRVVVEMTDGQRHTHTFETVTAPVPTIEGPRQLAVEHASAGERDLLFKIIARTLADEFGDVLRVEIDCHQPEVR